VATGLKLSEPQLQALNRICDRLREQGLCIGNRELVLALLKAAAQLPEDELVNLIKDGIDIAEADDDRRDRLSGDGDSHSFDT
jgi:hypothetical protein